MLISTHKHNSKYVDHSVKQYSSLEFIVFSHLFLQRVKFECPLIAILKFSFDINRPPTTSLTYV